ALKANNIDLFVSPDGYLSLATDVPSVAVMHDLNFEHRPQDLPGAARMYYRNNFPKFARRAKRIATVSEYSKKDIVQTYGIDPGIIDVVYDGANEAYCPLDDAEQLEVRKSASGGCPYFLYIGALHRRKNIIGMLSAFELFKERSRSEVKFLLIGDPLWKDKSISSFVKTMNFRNDVQFLGYKSEQEIARLLPSALALVLVSFFEGFGIPVLEAMYCDVPVITSTVTALPEVAGKAALLVNPESVEEIGQAMEKIWADTALRRRLVEKGREQRKLFSWQQTAEKMWGCIEKSAAC
ncbi:MAG: glycosyltransferase family 4 protein, partial [Flavobacteriales bacterium]